MTPSEKLVQEFNTYQSEVKLKINPENCFKAILKEDIFIDTECHPINVNKNFDKTIMELVNKYYGRKARLSFNNTRTIFWVYSD